MRTALIAAALALSFSSLARADESLLNTDPAAAEGAKMHTQAIREAMRGDSTKLNAERHSTDMGRQESHNRGARTSSAMGNTSRERTVRR